NTDGTIFSVVEAALAWAPSPEWRVGGGFQLVPVRFSGIHAFSGCPSTIVCAPEDLQWDGLAQVRTFGIVPSANFGVQRLWERFRLGAALQLPVWISTGGTLRIPALPSSPFYDSAHIEGDEVEVRTTLPPVVRVGGELRPSDRLRIETEVDYEAWSMHDAF